MGKMVEANFALPLKLKGRGKREFLEIQRLLGTKRYSRYIYIYIYFVEHEGNNVPRIRFTRNDRNRYSSNSLIFNLLLIETSSSSVYEFRLRG